MASCSSFIRPEIFLSFMAGIPQAREQELTTACKAGVLISIISINVEGSYSPGGGWLQPLVPEGLSERGGLILVRFPFESEAGNLTVSRRT